ncbi:class I lanthipeptide [Chitinophaga niastensis]|uniref:class I lanthipeptide n=1 Tax=Chitinophaga niastensis TaxID=536980 RepID=UPI001304BF66|nr:class I lanthipeptide [Chitinophaga niastensis]
MKKKKLEFSKKLMLKKETLVELNQQEASKLVGGIRTMWSACCVNTNEPTCPDGCVFTQ